METDYGSLGDQIKKLTELTEENNRMLKGIRRDRWLGMLFNVVFWGILFIASYYLTAQFLGPMLGQSGGGGTDFTKLFEQYQAQFNQ